MSIEAVIGLEVHAQLLTRSKIFCPCSTRFGAPPNSHTCPVCLGMPGVLPVLNREAVRMAVLTGLALGCRINQRSVFARKNYFYPDLPKGYQISQYDRPIGEGGSVEIPIQSQSGSGGAKYEAKRFRLIRIHLEEDAGKSIHEPGGDSLVNLNRTGVPLVEIVTEADFRSPEEAYEFFQYLRQLLLYLEVCDGNMEEGSLRCDANVSVRPAGSRSYGTKTEIKNLNSFRFVRKALAYEVERQTKVLTEGREIRQETRLWDDQTGQTVLMRTKEEAHDYRYFPDPDLLPVGVSDDWLEEIRSHMPELPAARRQRFESVYGLDREAAEMVTQSRPFADFYEDAARLCNRPTEVVHWMVGDLTRDLKKSNRSIAESPVSPARLAELVDLVAEGRISGKIAKDVFSEMFEKGATARQIIDAKGLEQISNRSELESLVRTVVEKHPEKVRQYQEGKHGLLGFFMGQVMRETKGQANPGLVSRILEQHLRGDA